MASYLPHGFGLCAFTTPTRSKDTTIANILLVTDNDDGWASWKDERICIDNAQCGVISELLKSRERQVIA